MTFSSLTYYKGLPKMAEPMP